jgi:hypothetical protein
MLAGNELIPFVFVISTITRNRQTKYQAPLPPRLMVCRPFEYYGVMKAIDPTAPNMLTFILSRIELTELGKPWPPLQPINTT